MAKIAAAHHRTFTNIFICKRCSAKIKAQPKKIAEGKIRCRKCKGNVFRTKRKKTGK
jgi:ribosomal protein L40E